MQAASWLLAAARALLENDGKNSLQTSQHRKDVLVCSIKVALQQKHKVSKYR